MLFSRAEPAHALLRWHIEIIAAKLTALRDGKIRRLIINLPPRYLKSPYLAELTAFPNGKHDDQVDSTAQLLDWFKAAGREPGGFYGYYRMLAEEASRS